MHFPNIVYVILLFQWNNIKRKQKLEQKCTLTLCESDMYWAIYQGLCLVLI